MIRGMEKRSKWHFGFWEIASRSLCSNVCSRGFTLWQRLICVVLRLFFLFAILCSAVEAQEPATAPTTEELESFSNEELPESPFVEKATLWSARIDSEPLSVLLVATTPERAEEILAEDRWIRACRRMGWSLAVLGVQMKPEIGSPDYIAAQESVARTLFSALDQPGKVGRGGAEGRSLPIFACLLEGASDWLLPAMQARNERVACWIARGLTRIPSVEPTALGFVNTGPGVPTLREDVPTLSPGLVIAANFPENRNIWEYWHRLRLSNLENPVAFLPAQRVKISPLYQEDFALQFLTGASSFDLDDEIWLNYRDGKKLPVHEVGNLETAEFAGYGWFPNAEVAGAWKALCPERPSEPDQIARMWSWSAPKLPPFFSRLEFHQNRIHKEPKALLLIAVDSDRPQQYFQSPQWIDFVRKQGWGILLVNLRDGTVRSHNQAAAWLETRIFDYIDKGAYKDIKDIPIVLYAAGRPAYWMQRLMVNRPERFRAWSVTGAPEFAVVPKDLIMPPGLLIAPRPEVHFPHLFFLQDLRKANRLNRVCLLARDEGLLPGNYLDELARQFLGGAAVEKPTPGFWLRFHDGRRLTLADSQQGVDPADYVWFPDDTTAGMWSLLSRARPVVPLPKIEKFVVKTGVEEQPELNLFVRIPGSSKGVGTVDGVFCFCTWQQEDTSLLNRLKKPDDPLVTFADRNRLAVITWNTAALLPPGVPVQGLDEAAERELNAKFDRIGKAWLDGVKKVCRTHKLPDKDFLIHGISRGSSYAHRLVLRYPESFLAAHTHIASYYDPPNAKASNVLWLLTTGEIDGGYGATREFYKKAQELNSPVLFKAGPSLGHAMRDDIEGLSLEFFDYALSLRRQAIEWRANPPKDRGDTSKLTAADLFRERMVHAGWFGDFINHEVYPKNEGEWIPESQRIPLPTEALANAWSAQPEKGL
jgi:hypothetical protein